MQMMINIKYVLRHIYQEVENAKIRLSANERTSLELDFTFADDQVELDVLLLRSDVENLAAPIVDRAIEICLRLIAQHGLTREQIGRVVLVGGPAHMPIVKQRVTEHLAPLAEDSGDPMTLVARGAALYATTIGLKNEATVIASESPVDACDLWIQYPSVSSDLSPDIMGRNRCPDEQFTRYSLSKKLFPAENRAHFFELRGYRIT